MKKTIFTFVFVLINLFLYAQDSLLYRDPLAGFGNSYSLILAEGVSNVNTNYPSIIYHGTPYVAALGQYSPTSELLFDFGKIYNLSKSDKMDELLLFNFGYTFKFMNSILTDSNNDKLNLSQWFVTIPVSIGFRYPLNTVKAHLRFSAAEVKVGGYYSILVGDRITQGYDIDANFNNPQKYYSNFGIFIEADLSFLDKRGHGHIFGIRESGDFSGSYLGAGKDLPPVYESFTLFYNLENTYYKR